MSYLIKGFSFCILHSAFLILHSTTSLNNANLAFADLRGAKNIDFPFRGRGLTRANILLWQTIFPDGTVFPGPFLTTGYTSDLLREVNR